MLTDVVLLAKYKPNAEMATYKLFIYLLHITPTSLVLH